MFENVKRAILKNPKTTVPALTYAVASVVAHFGFDVSAEFQASLAGLAVLVIGLLAGDGGKDVTIIPCGHPHGCPKAASYTVVWEWGKTHACSNHVQEMQGAPGAQVFKIGE